MHPAAVPAQLRLVVVTARVVFVRLPADYFDSCGIGGGLDGAELVE
jgi:hypothetical protein